MPDSSGTVALLSDIAINPNILDSAAILAFTSSLDSAKTITLIGQNSIDSVGVIGLVDTTYINNRVDPGLDSTLTRQEIDTYVTKNYLVTNNLVLDSALVLDIIDSQLSSYLDSADFNNLARALEVSLIPDTHNARSLGTNTNRFSNAFIQQSVEIDSARLAYTSGQQRLQATNITGIRISDGTDSSVLSLAGTGSYNTGIRLALGQYAEASLPSDGIAGDLIIITDGDSATGGPTLAFKDSNNGTYIKFNTA